LLEFVTRRCIERQDNISLHSRCRVVEFLTSPDQTAVTGVRYDDAEGRASMLPSDLVLDASGRGALTLALLETIGAPKPQETEIGVDITYALAIFEIPGDRPFPWKGLIHLPLPLTVAVARFCFRLRTGNGSSASAKRRRSRRGYRGLHGIRRRTAHVHPL